MTNLISMTDQEESDEKNTQGTPTSSISTSAVFATSAKSAGSASQSSTVVTPQFLHREETNDPLISKPTTKGVKLKDMADVLRTSVQISSVTMEQIQRVRQMHKKFSEGTEFDFNYSTLLVVASVLAGLGLASGSGTTVIASMLVSPIMGPVVACAYGITISDYRLVYKALKTEVLSLLLCIAIGAIIGICTSWTSLAEEWPNSEQLTRTTWQNFWVGLPIAFFSGLGVAVSLLDDQTNSLVGVAISASLLPPAVNAGSIWVVYGSFENNRIGIGNLQDESGNETTTDFPSRGDFRRGGMISLFLTLANIVLIIISSLLMFRLKERLPIKKKVFWEDLRVARKIYTNRAFLIEDEEVYGGDTNQDKWPETQQVPGPINEEPEEAVSDA